MRLPWVVLVAALFSTACGDSGDSPESAETERTPEIVHRAARPLEVSDPAATPPVDLAHATVALEDVHFDTFDGGSVRLSDADPALIERLFDAIEPIDAPEYETVDVARAWLEPDDLVIGYLDPEGAAWAYAVRVLNSHEIVNDDLGGVPVLVTYCPLCASGVVYDRRLDGRLLSFSNTSALYENDLVMVDRETGTYWWQAPGRAIVGELSGSSLEPLVAETTTFGSWSERHPETRVMARPENRPYAFDPFESYPERVDQGLIPFPVDPAAMSDGRLSPAAMVVVAEVAGGVRAWPVAEDRTFTEEVAGATIEVVTDGVGGQVSVDGENVPVRTMFWFAAVSAYPEIGLGG